MSKMIKREILRAAATAWNYAVDVADDADTYHRDGYTVTVWWNANGARVMRVDANGRRVEGGYAAAGHLLSAQPDLDHGWMPCLTN